MDKNPIPDKIRILNNLMKRNADSIMNPTGERVTMMHTWILFFTHRRSMLHIDTFQKDIEAEFSINRSTTSEMLKLMTKKGMIKRVPVDYDARLKKIVLTEQSLEFVKQSKNKMDQLDQLLVKGVSQEEQDMFIKTADKLIANIKNSLQSG